MSVAGLARGRVLPHPARDGLPWPFGARQQEVRRPEGVHSGPSWLSQHRHTVGEFEKQREEQIHSFYIYFKGRSYQLPLIRKFKVEIH